MSPGARLAQQRNGARMGRVRRGLIEGEDGYELWLRYRPVSDPERLKEYRRALMNLCVPGSSATLDAIRAELTVGLGALLGTELVQHCEGTSGWAFLVATPATFPGLAALGFDETLERVGAEGFVIRTRLTADAPKVIVAANTEVGALYGVFALLRHLQTARPLSELQTTSSPKARLRILNHWDNLDGTIERGFAGHSLWDWFRLPHVLSSRYIDYARANASVGINGAVLTNVNASSLVLTAPYLEKVAALANVMRPYAVRVYLTARFSAPIEIGGLDTADPRAAKVQAWWEAKADEIYALIPDFGGFAVKANSEGQPGPHDYGRCHAEGANLLADALAPHGGVVMWRAFVYDGEVPEDRAKQAYQELVPQDGAFRSNVLLQVKNGPIDFQPREPHHPIFGAMPKTPLMLELQLTQEYLGNSTHLAYLAPLFEEVLNTDTFCQSTGSTVGKIVDGTLDGHTKGGIAAVANIGDAPNWCGHPFAAANWFAFGRQCWDYTQSSEAIAEDWLRMTFGNSAEFVTQASAMMMVSREAIVEYMTPLGLHHIMARDHHQGPAPWVDEGRPDWTSVYYHCADEVGLGFDRSPTGSAASDLYFPPYRDLVGSSESCPEQLLLWFHHVPWGQVLSSGNTLWDELCLRYQRGVDAACRMQAIWTSLEGNVDPLRFGQVSDLLRLQVREAEWWKGACLSYFQSFSKRPLPNGVRPPDKTLEEYRAIEQYFVPGIPERRF